MTRGIPEKMSASSVGVGAGLELNSAGLWHSRNFDTPDVNTTFRFINRNEFSPIETKIVYVNIASVA